MEAENELRSRLKIINRVVWDEQRMRIWSGSKTTRMQYEFQPGTKLIPEEKSFRYHINSPYLSSRRQRFSSQLCVADTSDYHHVASEKEQGMNRRN